TPTASSSDHDQRCCAPVSVAMTNSQSAVSSCGVGPAESTGKSSTSVCPGGRRGSRSPPRPLKPRVMKDTSAPFGALTLRLVPRAEEGGVAYAGRHVDDRPRD